MFSFLPLINTVEGPFVRTHQILAITISLGCAAVVPAVLPMMYPPLKPSKDLKPFTGGNRCMMNTNKNKLFELETRFKRRIRG